MTTTNDIIKKLVNVNTEIESVTLTQFPSNSILQERFPQIDLIKNAIDHALSIRSAYQLPFWDALLSSQFINTLYSPIILKEALFHNKIISTTNLNRKNIGSIDKFAFSTTCNVGINSKVTTTDQQIRHFILLDFHILNKFENIPCVEEVLKLLKLTGYLLETNKSYHFIGDKLVSAEELKQILYHALLFSPIIDKNWIAHQLIEGSCSLRITSKENRFPYLIKQIE